MQQFNILFDEKINGHTYIVTYGGNRIFEKEVYSWTRRDDDGILSEGRQEFADRFREVLELVDKFDDLKGKLASLGRLDELY